jgi:hypothetical protein
MSSTKRKKRPSILERLRTLRHLRYYLFERRRLSKHIQALDQIAAGTGEPVEGNLFHPHLQPERERREGRSGRNGQGDPERTPNLSAPA